MTNPTNCSLERVIFTANWRTRSSGHPSARRLHRTGLFENSFELLVEIIRQQSEQPFAVGGQLREAVAGKFQSELGLHAQNQFRLVEGLGYIINRPGLQAANNEILAVGGGKKDDWNVFSFGRGAKAAAGFKSVHTRHQKIEKNQVWCFQAGFVSGRSGRRLQE